MNTIPSTFTRRDALKATIASVGISALAFEPARAAEPDTPDARRGATKRYPMLKSINQWAFPYPQRMNLRECMQLAKDAGFDGIELNYDLDNDLSPKSGTKEYQDIRRLADKIGIRISGLCSFLFWPYPLTSNDPAKRAQGLELAGRIAQAAHDLGVENVLVVPGAVHIPWRTDHEPVPNDVCDQRAREAVGQLAKQAEKLKVFLNIENIFFNGYLMTPMEMNAFVDHFGSEHVRVHFDTGNISMFQHAEHWVPILGKRTKNIHLKEFTKKGTDYSLETFRPLLDGTTTGPPSPRNSTRSVTATSSPSNISIPIRITRRHSSGRLRIHSTAFLAERREPREAFLNRPRFPEPRRSSWAAQALEAKLQLTLGR